MSPSALLSLFFSYYSPQTLWPHLLSLFFIKDLELQDAFGLIEDFHVSKGLSMEQYREVKSKIDLIKEYEFLINKNIQILSPSDAHFPSSLFDLGQPPLGLLVYGNFKPPGACLSVVGSRECSVYTHQWMIRHLHPLAEKENLSICSGGARGVDDAAQRIALNANQSAYVFLPSGFGVPYPATIDLVKQVEKGAIFLTEFPYYCTMKKHHFQRRNRLIAAFSKVLFVAECRAKSGSMVTAQWAIDLHRTVATLPAFPDDISFSGNLQLLFEGAHIIRDQHDLKQLLNLSPHFFKARYRKS